MYVHQDDWRWRRRTLRSRESCGMLHSGPVTLESEQLTISRDCALRPCSLGYLDYSLFVFSFLFPWALVIVSIILVSFLTPNVGCVFVSWCIVLMKMVMLTKQEAEFYWYCYSWFNMCFPFKLVFSITTCVWIWMLLLVFIFVDLWIS